MLFTITAFRSQTYSGSCVSNFKIGLVSITLPSRWRHLTPRTRLFIFATLKRLVSDRRGRKRYSSGQLSVVSSSPFELCAWYFVLCRQLYRRLTCKPRNAKHQVLSSKYSNGP